MRYLLFLLSFPLLAQTQPPREQLLQIQDQARVAPNDRPVGTRIDLFQQVALVRWVVTQSGLQDPQAVGMLCKDDYHWVAGLDPTNPSVQLWGKLIFSFWCTTPYGKEQMLLIPEWAAWYATQPLV